MGTRLYVGNLSYTVTSQSLESLFAEHGRVKSAQVVQDRDTGRSKGFGFVEMMDGNEAAAAIQAMNLKEVDGRCLTVNEARPREEHGDGERHEGTERELATRPGLRRDPLEQRDGLAHPHHEVQLRGPFAERRVEREGGSEDDEVRRRHEHVHPSDVGPSSSDAPTTATGAGFKRSIVPSAPK